MSRTAAREIHRDSEPLFTGTHKGADSSATLRDKGVNFRALGVDPDLEQFVENETEGTSGTVTAADENTVTVDGVTWNNGDTYNIYATSAKDTVISSIWTDVSRGWKIEKPEDVNSEGWRTEDVDLDDRGRKNVFGPGQPEKR